MGTYNSQNDLAGVLSGLPNDFNAEGGDCEVDLGGAAVRFKLDGRGVGVAEQGRFVLRIKALAGGEAPFKVLAKKGTWSGAWADDGLDPGQDLEGTTLVLPARVTVGGKRYDASLEVTCRSKAGKGGRFKTVKH